MLIAQLLIIMLDMKKNVYVCYHGLSSTAAADGQFTMHDEVQQYIF